MIQSKVVLYPDPLVRKKDKILPFHEVIPLGEGGRDSDSCRESWGMTI